MAVTAENWSNFITKYNYNFVSMYNGCHEKFIIQQREGGVKPINSAEATTATKHAWSGKWWSGW